ncbi:MAG: pentapeptide repeat-containing protein [Rivularia sp. (in: cyanobacteria)]|jgi:hypothetical protein
MKFLFKKQVKQKKLPSSKLPSAKKDNYHLRRSGRYVSPSRLRKLINYILIKAKPSFLFIETQIVEPIAHLLDEWDLFRILEKVGFLAAAVIFIIEIPRISDFSKTKEQDIFTAWQIVEDGKGSKSKVVGLALERLHKEGFSLSGIDIYDTFLQKIELNNADLRRANFNGADLQNANLSGADLSNANLSGADLTTAELRRANISGADLNSTRLWSK